MINNTINFHPWLRKELPFSDKTSKKLMLKLYLVEKYVNTVEADIIQPVN
jgi:hypothetical protein